MVGIWIVDKFWDSLGAEVVQQNGYESHPETKRLLQWNAAFWIGSGLSIHRHEPNFFDLVKEGKIRIHIAGIDHLSKQTVHLTTGESIPAEVTVCSTGWKKEPSVRFNHFGEAGNGLPHSSIGQEKLSLQEDKDILTLCPCLKDQASLNFALKNDASRLYRFLVPPKHVTDRIIRIRRHGLQLLYSHLRHSSRPLDLRLLDGQLDRLARNDEVTTEVTLHP